MAQQIQLRRDTAVNWTAANPVLAQGELGLEYDTGKLKTGNGTQTWNTLPYMLRIEQLGKTIAYTLFI